MCRKMLFLICVAFLFALSGQVRAATWTGAGDGTSWYDSDNWDPNFPGQYEDADINSPPGQGPIIDGDVECGIVRGPCYDSAIDQGMDILGGNVKMNGMWRFKNGGTGLATVNITGGSVSVGGDWRWSDGGDTYAVVNVTGASVTCPRLKIGDDGGGELYIGPGAVVTVNGECTFTGAADTTLTLDGGLLDVKVVLELNTSQVSVNLDSGTLWCASYEGEGYAVDINDGVWVIDGNVVSQIESDIDNEYITAYDGASGSEVHVEYAAGTDETTVWATTIYTWARHPSPENGAKNQCADNMELTWTPGVYAAEHDVYFGTDYDDVKWAVTVSPEHRVRQEPNSYDASVLETLEPGETYYWRIDEVNDNAWAPLGSPWKGKVWSFSINDGNAYDPDPAHNETGVPLDANLSWMPGCSASSHKIYFGTSFEQVNNLVDPCATQGVGNETYSPGTLDYLTEYYWRIDEVNGPTTLKGPVWKFRSQSAIVDVNMLLWYKFDETDGMTARDSSGHEKDASVVGTTDVEWDPNGGRFDGCIHFTEAEALVVPADALHTVSTAITVSVWFNIDSGATLGNDYVIFDAGDLGSGGTNKLTGLIPDSAGDVSWRAGNDPCDVLVWADATPGAWMGDWHHFGFRKNEAAGTMTIFFDGLPVETRTGTDNTLSGVADTPFVIGCYNDENSGDYGGRMDDFRLFNEALADTEVASLFRGGEIELAWAPDPYDGEVDVPRDTDPTWQQGNFAVQHKVFFGTDWDDVNDMTDPCATLSVGTEVYDPGVMELDTTYYWRVDEVNDPCVWKGPVWRFTVADFLILDDFESYDKSSNLIWYTWYCKQAMPYGQRSGAYLALSTNPVHSGAQAMRYDYETDDSKYWDQDYAYADACLPLDEIDGFQDWTTVDVRLLTIFFYGQAGNDTNETEQMYMAVHNADGNYAEVRYGDHPGEAMSDLNVEEWQRWDVPFIWFTDSNAAISANVDFSAISSVYLGFGDKRNPVRAGNGTVFFDDLRLSLPICKPEYGPQADFSGNCIVDIADVGEMGAQWLRRDVNFADDLGIVVQEPCDANLVGHWKLDEGAGTFAEDSSANDNHGTLEITDEGGYLWVVGRDGNAVEFSGGRVYVNDNGSTPELRPVNQVSVAAWIRIREDMSSARCVVKGNNDNESYEIEIDNDDTFIFQFRDGNDLARTRYDVTATVWPEEWIHAAGTYDGSSVACYVNGELEDTADINNPYGLSQDTNGLAIGNKAKGDANDTPFEGVIDDVRVYNYGLSQAEVAWLATEGTGVFVLASPVNLFSGEVPEVINFKDFATLMESWLDEEFWPSEPSP